MMSQHTSGESTSESRLPEQEGVHMSADDECAGPPLPHRSLTHATDTMNNESDLAFLGDGGESDDDACPFSLSSDDEEDDSGPSTEKIFVQLPELHPHALVGISPTGALMMLSDPAYWRAICPQLHVCDPTFVERSTTTTVQPSDETIRGCRRRMNRDGYFDLPPAQVKMDIDLNALVLGITQLTELGWPPNFILMYDEAWFMVHQLEELIFQTTGNRLICDFSAFHVSGNRKPVPDSDAGAPAGWPPHRDRGEDSTRTRFRGDGSPEYATAWVALTSASPTNSCLYVVPKRHDPGYVLGDKGGNPLSKIFTSPSAFQHIRALPCEAGSVIVFSHRLLHWGSSADEQARSDKGEPARVALSFASASATFERPYVKDSHLPMPRPAVRAALICGLAIMYVGNVDPGAAYINLFQVCFQGGVDYFDENFVKLVTRNSTAYTSRNSQSSASH
eukprot:m.21342 g.21342  ORF g.21342 m.21342 type:complete len:449 (+) comp3882_c0_seq1:269-1615(+)